MDKRMKEALDRHITGNYGEDQFPKESHLTEEEEQAMAEALNGKS